MKALVVVACALLVACSKDKPAPSAPASKITATADAPAAPTNLRVEALTDTSVTVAWDTVEGATDYDLFYKTLSGPWVNVPHRTALLRTIYGLEPDTEYRWTVRAENKDGASRWVYGRKFTTLPTAPPDTLQSDGPTWIFVGDVSEEDQAALQEEMEAVRLWFLTRYGVEATDFAVLVSREKEAFEQAFQKHVRSGPLPDTPIGLSVEKAKDQKAIILIDMSRPALTMFQALKGIAHEYFHVVQGQLVTGTTTFDLGRGPYWLIEGSAQLAEYEYQKDKLGKEELPEYSPFRDLADSDLTASDLRRLEQKENLQGAIAHPIFTYGMALSALFLLADISEERAYVRYWELLNDKRWQDAFQEAFGLSIRKFYNQYEEWLPEQLPRTVYLFVRLEWPGSKNLSRRELNRISYDTAVGPQTPIYGMGWGGTAGLPDGPAHTISILGGTTWTSRLKLFFLSRDGCDYHFLGWYKNGELTQAEDQATLFEFTGADTFITWTLPDRPDKLTRLSSENNCE